MKKVSKGWNFFVWGERNQEIKIQETCKKVEKRSETIKKEDDNDEVEKEEEELGGKGSFCAGNWKSFIIIFNQWVIDS